MFDAINKSFQDATIKKKHNLDFSKTNISFTVSNGEVECTLILDIEAKLTQDDYELFLFDPNGYNNITDTWDNEDNSWSNFLNFEHPSYLLTTNVIESTEPFFSNLLLLTNDNNQFSINAIYDASGGVFTPTNDNNVKITLSLPLNIGYTKEDIVRDINLKLSENIMTEGSFIDVSNLKTIFRINVNKIFTAQDYRIVFFDSTFTLCNFGYPSSMENVKVDTTLGWILGFRNLPEYILSIDNLSINQTSTFYTNFPSQSFIVDTDTNIVKITGDTSINVNLYNYLLIVIDDFCQNHLNDGLITNSKTDFNIPLPSYANRTTYKCNPVEGDFSIADTGPVTNNNLTSKQIYSANQILNTKQTKQELNIYSQGPFVQDIFALIPVKTSGLSPGSTFVEFGGTMQNQERNYFGPVNIQKMSVQLLNDKGEVLDLNRADWSLSFLTEQLYNPPR
jgi:hypothetical protein